MRPMIRWFGIFGGAIAWLVHLLFSYGIAEFGCQSELGEALSLGISWVAVGEIGLTVAMMIVALSSTAIAMRALRLLRHGAEFENAATERSDLFLARSGFWSGVIFSFIIAIQAIPVFYHLGSC